MPNVLNFSVTCHTKYIFSIKGFSLLSRVSSWCLVCECESCCNVTWVLVGFYQKVNENLGHTRYWSWDPQHVELMWCHYTMWPLSVIYCTSSYFNSFLETHQFLLLFLFFFRCSSSSSFYISMFWCVPLSFFLFLTSRTLLLCFK